jgi:hypothetical protein
VEVVLLPLLWGAGPMALMLWLDGMMMMMMMWKWLQITIFTYLDSARVQVAVLLQLQVLCGNVADHHPFT